MSKLSLFIISIFCCSVSIAQDIQNNPTSNHGNKFEQLGTILPTANEYRTASGAPGPKYWQQRCDYTIKCELDEKNNVLTGSETLNYFNNSPDVLTYIWFQLDENEHSNINNANYQNASRMPQTMTDNMLKGLKEESGEIDNGNGIKIKKLTDANGAALKYTINKTMMRVDLPAPLKPGQKYILKIDWSYKVTDRMKYGGAEVMNILKKMEIICTQWRSGIRACVFTATFRDGKITNLPDAENLH
ncbi:gluzincin family metallopeptidase [Niabella ginsengisoli]|uniref:Aminopeptidase n=1 Tax=Niabella ginsengisoli TaxID=522298 RepID=A0ABS9SDU9_9BACT|nr:hypothetical protein [Niabella ginsengisoli]MCH5596511.1 hypothetical protein [Niabella ginsengisoli]